MSNCTILYMFENHRRGRQARNFTTNAPKILDLKSSSEQIFSRKLPLGAPETCLLPSTLSSASITCLSASLENKGLFSTANILQIADVVRRVVFLLFLLCFEPIVRLFLPREMSEMFRHFVLTTKTAHPGPQVFSVNVSIIWQFCCTIDVIFHIPQNSFKFGRQ